MEGKGKGYERQRFWQFSGAERDARGVDDEEHLPGAGVGDVRGERIPPVTFCPHGVWWDEEMNEVEGRTGRNG